jgi:Zn ribbon nucleic-acid-binding protein
VARTLSSFSSEKVVIPENRAGAKCPQCKSKRLTKWNAPGHTYGECSECNYTAPAVEFLPAGHHCHARGCGTKVKPELLMCGPHWRLVPKTIRDRVWATYREGQCDGHPMPSEEWHRAADAAIRAVAMKERFVRMEA